MNSPATARTSRISRMAAIVVVMLSAIIALLLVSPGTAHASIISFVSDSTAYGTVSKSSVSVAAGKKIGSKAATATAKSGYRFDGWYVDGKRVGTSLSNVKVSGNALYRAHFSKARLSSQNHSGAKALDTMGLVVDRFISVEGKSDSVILATAGNFPDALAASALAGATESPVVLTETKELSPQAAKRIKASGAHRIIVIGGEKAVSSKTASAALTIAKANAKGKKVYTTSGSAPATASLTRHYGANAVATAADVYQDNESLWGSTIVIATGDSFQDALSISPYCYREKAPVLLAYKGNLTWASKQALASAASSGSATDVIIVGGNKVVSQASEDYLEGLFPDHVKRLAGPNAYATSAEIAKWLVNEQGFQDNLVGFATGSDFRDAVVAGPLQGASNAPLVLVADGPAYKVGERWFVERAQYTTARFFGGVKAVPQGIRDEVEMRLVPTDIDASKGWTGSGTLAVNYATYAYATSTRLSTPKGLAKRGATYKYRMCDNGWVAVSLGKGKGLGYLAPGSWLEVPADSGSKWTIMVAKGDLKAYAAPTDKSRIVNKSWLFKYAARDARKYDKAGVWYAVKTAGGAETFYVKASQLRKPSAGELGAAKVMKKNNYFGNNLRKAFNWTRNHSYRHIDGNNYGSTKWAEKYAADFFKRNNGNCYSFAAAFCYLARQLGYDANVHAGYVPSAAGGAAPHGWVEIKRSGKTYVCDPELAYEIPSRNWYMNTYASAPVSYTR
ncbi:MAG: cell wall-binding repeat-containing protein [Coriobacteriales bacterium]|jgi:putative cell wall-binding protein